MTAITRNARRTGWIIVLAVVASAAAGAGETPAKERLLLGFEKDEFVRMLTERLAANKRLSNEQKAASVEKKVRENKSGDVTVMLAGAGEGQIISLRRGDTTQGEWAFAFDVEGKGGFPPGAYKRILNHRGISGRSRNDIINMCSLMIGLPGGKDWTGYTRLLLDVKSTTAAVFRLGVEDAEVWPPVERRFRVPGGKWVTVEMDLEKAVEARGLDLSRMANYYVFLEEIGGSSTFLADNLRLATKDATPKLPVVLDENPYEAGKRVYAAMQFAPMKGTSVARKDLGGTWGMRGRWKVMEFPADASPPAREEAAGSANRGPWRIDVTGDESIFKSQRGLSFVCSGVLTPVAYDARRIAIPVSIDGLVHAVCTTDSGATWKPAARPCDDWPVVAEISSATIVGYKQDGCGGGASTAGDETYLMSGAGCCLWNWHSDRLFFNKVELTETGWKVSPIAPVDGDLRHCSVAPAVLRLPSGRLWAAHSQPNRHGRGGVATYYSDDGGKTWSSWRPGKHARLPGSMEAGFTGGYGGDLVSLLPWGDHAACVVSIPGPGTTSLWTCEDTTWGEMKAFPELKGMVVRSALSPDGKAILMNTIGSNGAVYRYESGTCVKEDVTGYVGPADKGSTSYGFLSQSGDTVMLLGAAGFGKRRQHRFTTVPECTKILCWKRSPGGTWGKPVELVSEDAPVQSFTCTRFATDAGAVLAWTCEGKGWVKAMLVTP